MKTSESVSTEETNKEKYIETNIRLGKLFIKLNMKLQKIDLLMLVVETILNKKCLRLQQRWLNY